MSWDKRRLKSLAYPLVDSMAGDEPGYQTKQHVKQTLENS